ncbi:LysR family transcriptional regulator [Aestuariibius sp. HNIBRBA575]|uniref:LysR family transcriptional regulator n=1 Tax=Aestuariibius sp. HNIBRBA575 TaxID=3233343 RepID=UPI0034A1CA1B
MENWDEVRTAFQVARLGTVSGAADVLGVHHATVIRHIDALETRLGVKLFQRHARGYTATEAGQDLMQIAKTTDDQFAQLAGRLKGQGAGVSGDLVVTSLPSLSALMSPVLVDFQAENDGLVVRYLTSPRVFRLEYGEAHVAIRAGAAPEEPDNVVQPFIKQRLRLVASDDYIARFGKPEQDADLTDHQFVGIDKVASRVPFNRWIEAIVASPKFAYRTEGDRSMLDAIASGAGIGFVTDWDMERLGNLTEVVPSRPEWVAQLWLVTHVDLHRSPKVQSFLKFLKERSKDWNYA